MYVVMVKVIKKCAIYTRKSTDEGLDQDFNTLDAQREACEAYIKSQMAEGWRASPKKYNDGGYSGGTMERPALQGLIEDIKTGQIDIIVVYKIDRLTRSLMDFSKLVDVFDEHSVTFVSVTQSFNTTTSMGRLTLNVLLSFAQFEREVTAERIRDKFKASKQKGMWMGGFVPIGYRVEDRHLLINDDHKEFVQNLFNKYLEIKSVSRLKEYLDQCDIVSPIRYSKKGKQHGGSPISRGALHAILCNPIYIGKIKHKSDIYDGLHQGIIEQEIWGRVQKTLINQSPTKRGIKKLSSSGLLKGKLFDKNGSSYTPVYTTKKGKQYHYYACHNSDRLNSKLPASEIEKTVQNKFLKALKNLDVVSSIFDLPLIDYIKDFTEIANTINKNHTQNLAKECVDRVMLHDERIDIYINRQALINFCQGASNITLPMTEKEPYILTNTFKTQRTTKGAIIISNSDNPLDLPPNTIKQWVQGIVWRDEHFDGKSMKQIAQERNVSSAYIAKCINLSLEIRHEI